MPRKSRSLPWLILCLCIPTVTNACLWDRGTLYAESRGLPNLASVIVGRFERNPPAYYEIRLQRVADEIGTNPERLDLYDDAAVACDRLGRPDEAISWMAKKKQQLDKFRTSNEEHSYRYYANLGTFYAHRWFREKDPEKTDMKEAGRLISKAIEINPDAHFGRERYQLLAIYWILDSPTIKGGYYIPTVLHGLNWDHKHDAIEGLAGLIVLGAAWESVDSFRCLG